jgi:hypothetical protein
VIGEAGARVGRCRKNGTEDLFEAGATIVAVANIVLAGRTRPAKEVGMAAGQPTNNGSASPSSEALQRYGQYAYLLGDPHPTSREIIGLIDDLRMTRGPTVTSRIGAIISPLALMIVAGLILRGIPFLASLGNLLLFPGVLLVIIGYLLYTSGTRYTIDRGRIEVTSGTFSRRTTTVDLWRVSDIVLERSLVNRITGDGTLDVDAYYATGPTQVKLVGLAKMPELEEIRVKLLNLVGLLRSHPSAKSQAA